MRILWTGYWLNIFLSSLGTDKYYVIPKLLEKLVWSKAKLIFVKRKTLSLGANLFRVHRIFYHCDWWCLFKRTIFLACRNDLRNVRCRFIHIDGWLFSLNPILIRQLFNLKFVWAKNEDMQNNVYIIIFRYLCEQLRNLNIFVIHIFINKFSTHIKLHEFLYSKRQFWVKIMRKSVRKCFIYYLSVKCQS